MTQHLATIRSDGAFSHDCDEDAGVEVDNLALTVATALFICREWSSRRANGMPPAWLLKASEESKASLTTCPSCSSTRPPTRLIGVLFEPSPHCVDFACCAVTI